MSEKEFNEPYFKVSYRIPGFENWNEIIHQFDSEDEAWEWVSNNLSRGNDENHRVVEHITRIIEQPIASREIKTPIGAVVKIIPLTDPYMIEKAGGPGVMLRSQMANPADNRIAGIVLSRDNVEELSKILKDWLE